MVQTVIKKEIKVKGKADVAYVIDVTKSMAGCLENLKAGLAEITNGIKEMVIAAGAAEPELAFNVLGFRDLVEDEDKQMIPMGDEFTKDMKSVADFLGSADMKAMGGGDEAESALDALYIAATQMKWTRPAKVIVLFTDAPPRDVLHPKTTNGVPLDHENSMAKVKEVILEKKIRVVIFGPKDVKEFKMVKSWDGCFYEEMEKAEDTLSNFATSDLFKKVVIPVIVATVGKSGGFTNQ
jgi:hypothetical protein